MTDARSSDLHLVYGKWESMPRIVPDGCDDIDAFLTAQGWHRFLVLGAANSTMRINSWRRHPGDQPVEYLVDVDDINSVSSYLRVDTLPELMDLFARWAPAVQAAAITVLIDDLTGLSLNEEYGLVETVTARVVHGAEHTLPRLHRREQMYREQAARKRAAQEAERGSDQLSA